MPYAELSLAQLNRLHELISAQSKPTRVDEEIRDALVQAEEVVSLPEDGTVQDGKAYSVYHAADMFVLIVLPGFTSLTCGDSEPVDDAVMETFSARDLAVMLTLLRAAEQEIITAQGKANDRAMRERYGEPFGYPAPMPMGVPAPAPVPQP